MGCVGREPLGGSEAELLANKFIKIHRTLQVTPAMAAGVATGLWEVSDLVRRSKGLRQESSVAAKNLSYGAMPHMGVVA